MRGICNMKCLHWFQDGMFTRQSDLYVQYERQLQPEMSTSILRWDVHKTVWAVWKASAPGNVYLDSEMGHLQDTLIRFWDGTFTRHSDLYERHLQQEMSTSILRWDIYKTLWSDSEMGHLQDTLIRFWDGTLTRQFDLYKRHLQQEMSTLILRWDVYKTVWSVSVYERHLHQEMSTSIPRRDVYKTVWSAQEASATWTSSTTEWWGVFMIRHFSRASFICMSRYLEYEMATFIPRWDLYKRVWYEQLRWAIQKTTWFVGVGVWKRKQLHSLCDKTFYDRGWSGVGDWGGGGQVLQWFGPHTFEMW